MKLTTLAAIAAAGLLAGCANKYDTLTPELQASMMSDLRAGKPTLDCGLKCKLTWENQAPVIHQLDIAERWPELAVRVMQIGYGSDLAYYYLGQSAQGLQYHDAAIAYYNDAYAVASGGNALLRCEDNHVGGGDSCQGVNIATSIPVLVQASRDALAVEQARELAAQAPPPQSTRHHHRKPAAPPAAQQSDGWQTPPPVSAAAQPASAQSASAQPASEQPASAQPAAAQGTAGASQGDGWATPPAPR